MTYARPTPSRFLQELRLELRELLLVKHRALGDALLVLFRVRRGLPRLFVLALHDAPLDPLLELLELPHDGRLVPRDGLAALLQAPVHLLLGTAHVRALRLAQERGFLRERECMGGRDAGVGTA